MRQPGRPSRHPPGRRRRPPPRRAETNEATTCRAETLADFHSLTFVVVVVVGGAHASAPRPPRCARLQLAPPTGAPKAARRSSIGRRGKLGADNNNVHVRGVSNIPKVSGLASVGANDDFRPASGRPELQAEMSHFNVRFALAKCEQHNNNAGEGNIFNFPKGALCVFHYFCFISTLAHQQTTTTTTTTSSASAFDVRLNELD